MGAPWQKVTHKFAQLFGASAHFARFFAAFQFIDKVCQIFNYTVILLSAPEWKTMPFACVSAFEAIVIGNLTGIIVVDIRKKTKKAEGY